MPRGGLGVEDQIRLEARGGALKLLIQGNNHGILILYQRMKKDAMV